MRAEPAAPHGPRDVGSELPRRGTNCFCTSASISFPAALAGARRSPLKRCARGLRSALCTSGAPGGRPGGPPSGSGPQPPPRGRSENGCLSWGPPSGGGLRTCRRADRKGALLSRARKNHLSFRLTLECSAQQHIQSKNQN